MEHDEMGVASLARSLSGSHLNRCSGASRARTDDLLHAMQALFQLSYSPESALNRNA
jgi:hypothetical protein